MGSLVKQWTLRQTAEQADWLIGPEVFTPGIEADALRSMKAPGHAYDNDTFGKDPQPAHMDDYVDLPDTDEGDNGGVHINSGIPNHAFYLAAVAIGGHAWEVAGRIWYQSLRASTPTTDFAAFAQTTISKAGDLTFAARTFSGRSANVPVTTRCSARVPSSITAAARSAGTPCCCKFATMFSRWPKPM